MTAIRHIVFDIGEVLIHYDPHLAFAQMMPDEGDREWFFDNVCTSDWNLEQDRGRSWAEAEAFLISAYPSHEQSIRHFRRNWLEMVPYAYDDSVAVMERLIDGGHDVTMLTNFAADTFSEAKQRFVFLKRPRGVTVSGEIGLIKPDIRIFQHHARSFALEPEASLFIDDSQKNVDGAKAAGWQAVLFTNADTLKSDMRRLGIDT